MIIIDPESLAFKRTSHLAEYQIVESILIMWNVNIKECLPSFLFEDDTGP